jgi:signal transduction histidine kinase
VGLDDIKSRIEAALGASEQARAHAQLALDELEAARRDAPRAQLAAERGQRIAEAARVAAEHARDAAERAKATAEDAVQEAELAHRHLQDFLAMATHDLRGPLASIAGYTDVLSFTTRPDERDADLAAIQMVVLQMERLVQDIVEAGRLGAGAFHLRPEPLDLVPLVRQVASGQQTASGRHRVVIDAPERLEGEWDPDRLGQVMTNLISNAIKYSPPGGDITIGVRHEGDAAVVTISDRGRGIDPADMPLLFRPFTRLLPLDEQERVNGTGLGLYISDGIIRAHGGSIWATSQGVGTGSIFGVRLPLSSRA